ncbi:MAG: dienelactone hydrolase family protein [Pseudomonadota bacterium]
MPLRTLAAVMLVISSASAAAATPWPDYMPRLKAAISENTVDAKLPENVRVVAPEANVPAEHARFSGLWSGWACRSQFCDVKIAVERVDEASATVVYARAYLGSGTPHDRLRGRFKDGELHGSLPDGRTLALRLRDDGDMEMLVLADGRPGATGVLTQRELEYTRERIRLATDLGDDGAPLSLAAIVYRPRADGPLKTLLFHHGSTGGGNDPSRFSYTWTNPRMVRWFVQRGWQVILPQRRGRGASEGVYSEGLNRARTSYACEAELSLGGATRALEDADAILTAVLERADVDPQKILFGGYSRGGIVALVHAAESNFRPLGVVNFVGGWMGDGCEEVARINPVLTRRGADSKAPTLWLHGDRDPYYSIAHSRKNFATFETAGGTGTLVTFRPPERANGHDIIYFPRIWGEAVEEFLDRVE